MANGKGHMRPHQTNKTHQNAPHAPIDVRKVPADSVPYGESISTHGSYVWAAYDAGVLVCVAGTAPEVRRKYRLWVTLRRARREAAAPDE